MDGGGLKFPMDTMDASAIPIPESELRTGKALLLALPGGGCAPEIYDEVSHPEVAVHVVDWGRSAGPWALPILAQRLAATISTRSGITLLAGHSVGGVISMLTALAAPDAVHGLLLANTGAHTAGLGDPNLPQRIRTSWNAAAAEEFLRSCFWRPPSEALWRRLVDYLADIDTSLFAEATTSLRQIDLRDRLPELRCPAVIAFGRHDQRRKLTHAFELADGIPDSALMLLPAGHTPMVEAPSHFNDALGLLLAMARHKRANPRKEI
jgi:pimeloyl-ACP methyl ester carboxylesterase